MRKKMISFSTYISNDRNGYLNMTTLKLARHLGVVKLSEVAASPPRSNVIVESTFKGLGGVTTVNLGMNVEFAIRSTLNSCRKDWLQLCLYDRTSTKIP